MTSTELPFRATLEQACDYLSVHDGAPWTLARLIEHAVTPFVWLDYDAAHPALFGDANGGYAAPIFFEGDTARLAAGSEDVLITITKDAYKIVARLPPPGFRRPLHELRFQRKDLERLAAKLKRDAQARDAQAGDAQAGDAKALPASVKVQAARESQTGIGHDQVLAAFAGMLRIDLEQALRAGGGIFGDDGARVKGSAKKAKNKALWNPVTLALGLNDVYRVPMSQLKRAFASHGFLAAWSAEWHQSLSLLGK